MGIMERYLCLYDELGFHYKTGFIYKRIRKPGKVFYTILFVVKNYSIFKVKMYRKELA